MAVEEDPLAALREAIDALDDQLLDLLNRRAQLAEQVAARKAEVGGPYYAPGRERSIIERLQGRSRGPFPQHAIHSVFREVISACLSLQTGMRVAYLGPEATYTHQAVMHHFGTSTLDVPCSSIAAVFEAVERGQSDFGVVPVENSSEGVVNHTLDCFVDSGLRIGAEILLSVDHCLLARPGVVEHQVERIYSHPQALAQCRGWLQQNLPRAALVEARSTAAAARAAQGDAAAAALASELAGRLYHLQVLRHRVQDVQHNYTRFLVVQRPDAPVEQRVPEAAYKTSLLLSLSNEAGDLYRVIKPLSDAHINMTKIESRPTRRKAWEYVFFIDIDGHRDDPQVAPVLAQLAGVCQLCKVLGSYRRAPEPGGETA
jgi:chorismate mutase/prephenate dehydratase